FIIDNQYIASGRQFAQHFSDVSFVTLRAALIHGFFLGDPFFRFPIEHVPVAHQDFSLAQLVQERWRHDVEFVVEIILSRRLQDLQPAFYRQPRRDDEDMLRIAGVLRISNLVDDLPGNQHRHDNSFAGPRGHLGTQPGERAAVRRNFDTDFLRCRRLGKPDERFHRFQLAEKELMFAFVGIVPMLQQPLGDAGHSEVARFAPRLYARANLVDQRNRYEYAWIVESFRALRRNHIPGGPPAFAKI